MKWYESLTTSYKYRSASESEHAIYDSNRSNIENTTQEYNAGEERGESKVKRMLRQQQLSDI